MRMPGSLRGRGIPETQTGSDARLPDEDSSARCSADRNPPFYCIFSRKERTRRLLLPGEGNTRITQHHHVPTSGCFPLYPSVRGQLNPEGNADSMLNQQRSLILLHSFSIVCDARPWGRQTCCCRRPLPAESDKAGRCCPCPFAAFVCSAESRSGCGSRCLRVLHPSVRRF